MMPLEASGLSVASYSGTIPDGWRKVGDLTALDAIADGQALGLGARVWYGYLLVSISNPLEFACVIRGTANPVEWFEDFESFMIPGPPQGMVEQGFWNIGDSMQFVLPGGKGLPAAAAIAAVIPSGASVDFIGHSLGSALTTYLMTQVAAIPYVAGQRNFSVGGILFASPKPGDGHYASYVDQTVGNLNYIVCNYLRDVVPRTPITLPFLPFAPLPHVMTIRPSDSTAVIPDNIASNHRIGSYQTLLANWQEKAA